MSKLRRAEKKFFRIMVQINKAVFSTAKFIDDKTFNGLFASIIGALSEFVGALKANRSPLNEDSEFAIKFYAAQENKITIKLSDGDIALPQALLISPHEFKTDNEIIVKWCKDKFHTDHKVISGFKYYEKLAKEKHKTFFNGDNARLKGFDKTKSTLIFQRSKYFDYVGTNFSMDQRAVDGKTLRERISGNGKLEDLEESVLGNAAGINSLLFTSDRHLIVQLRNEKVLIFPGTVCPGYSGTVDEKDFMDATRRIKGDLHLSDINVTREGAEEVALRRRGRNDLLRVREIKAIVFLGVTRELVRGGCPEIFYSADLNVTSDDILKRHPEHKEGEIIAVDLGKFNIYGMTKIPESIKGTLSTNYHGILEKIKMATGGELSFPLEANLALWLEFNCPGSIQLS